MPDEADPPRKNYGFKEREFVRDNRPASASQAPMPTAQDLAKLGAASPAEVGGALRPDKPAATGNRTSGHKAPPIQSAAKPGDPNDVHAILQQNRAAEKIFGGDLIEIRKVSTRRKRDYWLIFLTAEIFFGGVVVIGAKGHNPFFLVFGLAGMVILGIGITWVMWQLLDRY